MGNLGVSRIHDQAPCPCGWDLSIWLKENEFVFWVSTVFSFGFWDEMFKAQSFGLGVRVVRLCLWGILIELARLFVVQSLCSYVIFYCMMHVLNIYIDVLWHDWLHWNLEKLNCLESSCSFMDIGFNFNVLVVDNTSDRGISYVVIFGFDSLCSYIIF